MLNDIRVEKNRFQPAQDLASGVAKLEERVVMNSSFKFPAGFVGMTPGQKGNWVMTSRAYGEAQRTVDRAFSNFAGGLARLQKQYGAGYIDEPKAQAAIGIAGGLGSPIPASSLLGRLNSALVAAENKFPYGRGFATAKGAGGPLGVGLSIFSASANVIGNPTSAALLADPHFDGDAVGASIPELMQTGLINLSATPGVAVPFANEQALISFLRQSSLMFKTVPGLGVPGLMPNYILNFGSVSGGMRFFSTKNT